MSQPIPVYTSPYLWPETLIERTRSSRKSHGESWYRNGQTKPPLAPSMCSGTSSPFSSRTRTSTSLMPTNVVGVAGERRAQHGGDPDRVLVDVRLDVLGADRELLRLQGDDAQLDVEVAAELVPTPRARRRR